MDKLGIQLSSLLTQIVNFTIMLIVLTKFLYKPILKALKDRKQKIADGLKYAEKMQFEEEKMVKKREDSIKQAKQDAKIILEKAKKDALAQKAEILEAGKKETSEMKVKLEKEMEDRSKEAAEEISRKTVDIAASMTKRLLEGILTDENQHALINRELRKLERSHET